MSTPAPRKAFALAAAERAAIAQAQADYLELLDLDRREGRSGPDREAFMALRRAARALLSALEPFHEPSPERARLLLLLRHAEQPLEQLAEAAAQVAAACDAELGDGRGLARNEAAVRWTCLLASRWAEHTGRRPSAAERGRFWSVLDHVQRGNEQALRLDHRLPRLSRDLLRAVLPLWLPRHRALGGQ